MIRFFLAILFALAGAASVWAQTPSGGGKFYTVDLRLEDGERLVGTPKLVLREGQPAIITVKGASGYSLRATLTTVTDRGQTKANFSTEIYLASNDGWQLRGSPWISAPLNQQATAEIAGRGATGAKPLKITFRATEGALAIGAATAVERPCASNSETAWRKDMLQPVSSMQSMPRPTAQDNAPAKCCVAGCVTCCGGCCGDPSNCTQSCCS